MKEVTIQVPDGKRAEWVNGVLTIVDELYEPKFKVGDYIVYDLSGLTSAKKAVRQIVSITDKCYILDGTDFNCYHFKDLESSNYHLWSVEQDAKDGDILVTDNRPFIYNGFHCSATVGAYCGITIENQFIIPKCESLMQKNRRWTTNKHITPATESQKDALFIAIKEAGYKWDAKKKKLIKITNVTERIKTFEDACEELGDEHQLVKEYWGVVNVGLDISQDLIAYLKLRIIVAALNEGWEPQFSADEKRYFPWFWLYTQEQYEEMDEDMKHRCILLSCLTSYTHYSFVIAGAICDTSHSYSNRGSQLAFRTSELAKYAGKQFMEEWLDFILNFTLNKK